MASAFENEMCQNELIVMICGDGPCRSGVFAVDVTSIKSSTLAIVIIGFIPFYFNPFLFCFLPSPILFLIRVVMFAYARN